ncbi:MAG TPA: YqiA/YcfP family alpha/beta fold hydrolase [Bryobacteraceae bacterium]|nr:YqiA/YcfP family alpha/beta fold hydrolase [Bryobacteraceae bacterium]
MTRIVYLHGFSSSPQSSKARFFAEKFHAAGVPFVAPQLDQGHFETLTISGQLTVVEQAVDGGPVVLMGSSLGGYLAALYAARHVPDVEKLVLMAPAFRFPSRWKARFSEQELATWKARGSMPFFHYGYNEERELGYQLIEDAAKYEGEPSFPQPALILHGRNDDVVPAAASEQFAQRHPNAQLRLLDSGHELTDVTGELWALTAVFLAM